MYSVEPSAHSPYPIRKDSFPPTVYTTVSLFAHCQLPELTEQDGHSRWAPVLSFLSLHALPVPPSWHGPAAVLPFPACCGDRAGPSGMCQACQHPHSCATHLSQTPGQPLWDPQTLHALSSPSCPITPTLFPNLSLTSVPNKLLTPQLHTWDHSLSPSPPDAMPSLPGKCLQSPVPAPSPMGRLAGECPEALAGRGAAMHPPGTHTQHF